MFRAHLDKEHNHLTASDYYSLAVRSENYLPTDIANICSRVRRQRFKRADAFAAQCKKDPFDDGFVWPCPFPENRPPEEDDNDGKLLLPPANMNDLERAMRRINKRRAGVQRPDLTKFIKFAEKYGLADIPTQDD
jgi:hypothetical protein